MNLPNKLTISRIALTFIFMAFLYMHGILAKTLALCVFLLASLTDILDGYLAKKNNKMTDFGRLMDPIADKILVLSSFLAFVQFNIIPSWMFIVIILREITITGLRALSYAKGKIIPANQGGKHKTVSQIIAILLILLFLMFREGQNGVFPFWNGEVEGMYKNFIFAWMLFTISLTLISGTVYLVKNREVYFNAKTG